MPIRQVGYWFQFFFLGGTLGCTLGLVLGLHQQLDQFCWGTHSKNYILMYEKHLQAYTCVHQPALIQLTTEYGWEHVGVGGHMSVGH